MKKIQDRIVRPIPEDALLYGVQPIFDRSQEYVPVRTGELKRSGKIEIVTGSRGQKTVEISYGDPEPFYAIYQHEIPFRHDRPPNPPLARWKYLESAVNELKDDVVDRILDYMERTGA